MTRWIKRHAPTVSTDALVRGTALVSVLLGALPAVLAPPVQPRDAHRSVRAAAGSTAPEVGVS